MAKTCLKYLSFAIIIIQWIAGTDGRCGYPEIPHMANGIESKDFFEEGETLSVSCVDSVAVGQTMRDHVIECRNNAWNSTSLRCSRIQNMSSIDIIADESAAKSDSNLKEREFLYLTDNDPMTCVLLTDQEKWVLHLSDRRFVSHIALIATFVDAVPDGNDLKIEITVSLPDGQTCALEEMRKLPNSVLVFLIYKCPESQPSDSLTMDLNTQKYGINVCGLEPFTLITEDCGKPEIPLYSYANQMRIQNGTKIAEYMCAKGYRMIGHPTRTCTSHGLWSPASPPFCEPEISCGKHTQPNVNYTLEYRDFDLFGNAIPDVSIVGYHCANRSEVIVPRTEVYCMADGNWTEVDYEPECHPRPKHTMMIHHFLNDKHLIYYGGAGLTLLFVGSFVILFHMRRLAKKISKQMREKSYYDQEKQMPHYSNESNYQDMTNLFNADPSHPSNQQSEAVPTVQSNDRKY